MGILLVEHDMDLVMRVCTRASTCWTSGHPGRRHPRGRPGRPRVRAAYLGTEEPDAALEGAPTDDGADAAGPGRGGQVAGVLG